MKKIFFIAIFILLFASCTINKPQEEKRTITVNGSGTVYITPDRATVVFAVVTQSWVAATAVQENARIMSSVIEALRTAGIRDQDISTSDYRVNQQGTWNGSVYTPGRYRADNNVTVTVRNIEQSGSVIDSAIGAGANALTSISFSSSDIETAKRQARTLAVQDAQNAAALFAGASGAAVGNMLSLTEYADGYYANAIAGDAKVQSTSATPISAGRIAVTSNITVTYAMQ